jgi:hypothetical protein
MPTYLYATGAFNYAYTQGNDSVPTSFVLKWGTTVGVYPNTHSISAASYSGSHPYVGVLPGSGHYHAVLVVMDGAAERTMSPDVEFDLSVTDPTLTITSPTSNPTYTAGGLTITLGGTATPSGEPGSTITGVQYFNSTTSVGAACTGTTAWTSPTITLVSGTNNISVWCTTSDGRTGTDTIVVTAPITNPTLTITGPTSNPTYSIVSQYINLYGSATPSSVPGSTVVSVQYYNDQSGLGGVCAGTTSWGVLVGPLVTGINHISVWSTTSDGRSGADAIDVTSIAVPTIVIAAPTSDPTYATATASIDLAGSATPSSVVGSTITSVAYLHSETSATAPCTGTTSWVSPTIALIPGVNTIVLTVTTSDPLTAQDTIVVTYTPLPPVVVQGNLLVLCVM